MSSDELGKNCKYHLEQVASNLRDYTKEEISKLLSLADIRDCGLILLMTSAEVRVGAIKSLKLKHIARLHEQNNIGLLRVYPESKDNIYNLKSVS